jgi:hypothetical protein
LRADKETIHFPGKVDYLQKILKKLTLFGRNVGQINRSLLKERWNVVQARIFFRKMKEYWLSGRHIIYTDGTFLHSSHCVKKCWQSHDVSKKAPFSRGERFIIVHTGLAQRFIKGACLLFEDKSSSGDYHLEMNCHNLNKWLNEMLIPDQPPSSEVVAGNALYHNLQEDKCPTQITRKFEIQNMFKDATSLLTRKCYKQNCLIYERVENPSQFTFLTQLWRDTGIHGNTCIHNHTASVVEGLESMTFNPVTSLGDAC